MIDEKVRTHTAGPMTPEGVQRCTNCDHVLVDYRNTETPDAMPVGRGYAEGADVVESGPDSVVGQFESFGWRDSHSSIIATISASDQSLSVTRGRFTRRSATHHFACRLA